MVTLRVCSVLTQTAWLPAMKAASATSSFRACGVAHAGTTFPGYDSWRFTYALMAGTSDDITDRIKLDLG